MNPSRTMSLSAYLYAVEFSDGILKIGSATNVHTRIASLIRKALPAEVVGAIVSEMPQRRRYEMEALLRQEVAKNGARLARGKEWFHGSLDAARCAFRKLDIECVPLPQIGDRVPALAGIERLAALFGMTLSEFCLEAVREAYPLLKRRRFPELVDA